MFLLSRPFEARMQLRSRSSSGWPKEDGELSLIIVGIVKGHKVSYAADSSLVRRRNPCACSPSSRRAGFSLGQSPLFANQHRNGACSIACRRGGRQFDRARSTRRTASTSACSRRQELPKSRSRVATRPRHSAPASDYAQKAVRPASSDLVWRGGRGRSDCTKKRPPYEGRTERLR